jgi:hypothetical protein
LFGSDPDLATVDGGDRVAGAAVGALDAVRKIAMAVKIRAKKPLGFRLT